MKVIIAGSRIISDYETVVRAVKTSGFAITEMVSGGARGVDRLGERWAKEHEIPLKVFPADWDRYGSRGPNHAGIVRNREVAAYVGTEGGLIAIWDGTSPGTQNLIIEARMKGLNVSVLNLRTERQQRETAYACGSY